MAVCAVVAVLAAACSVDRESGERPVFGAIDGVCGVTVLTNDAGDEALVRDGVECLMDAVDAGRPAVWDLLVPTVEGDPILWRFETSGGKIEIVEDATRDAFGSGAVLIRTCAQIDDTGSIPAGSGCVDRPGEPFDLPVEIWPP